LNTTKKERYVKSGSQDIKLTAIGDIYIINEDPIGHYDAGGGISTEAIKKSTIIIPEAYENFSLKYPCTGKIVAIGEDAKYKLRKGDRVCYGRLGGQREKIDGKDIMFIRERELLAVIL